MNKGTQKYDTETNPDLYLTRDSHHNNLLPNFLRIFQDVETITVDYGLTVLTKVRSIN